jgi:hypothetical protein
VPGGGVVWVILVLNHLSEVPRQEINDLIGGVAEVRYFLMTTEFDVPSPGSEQVDGDATVHLATVHLCDVCGHARLSHDAIASRFCRASRDRALDRDCACANRGSTADTEKGNADSAVQRLEAPMYGRGRFSRT